MESYLRRSRAGQTCRKSQGSRLLQEIGTLHPHTRLVACTAWALRMHHWVSLLLLLLLLLVFVLLLLLVCALLLLLVFVLSEASLQALPAFGADLKPANTQPDSVIDSSAPPQPKCFTCSIKHSGGCGTPLAVDLSILLWQIAAPL